MYNFLCIAKFLQKQYMKPL